MENEALTSPGHAQTGSDRNSGCMGSEVEVEVVQVVQMALEVVNLPDSRSVEVDRPFQVVAVAVDERAWVVLARVLVDQTFLVKDPWTNP